MSDNNHRKTGLMSRFDPDLVKNDHFEADLSLSWLFNHDITFNRSRSFAVFCHTHVHTRITHSRSSDFELTNTQTPTHLILWIIDNFNLFRVKNYVNPGVKQDYMFMFVNNKAKMSTL